MPTRKQEEGTRSPPSKRTRQGTIGAEDRAQIMAMNVNLVQEPTTGNPISTEW